MGTRVAIVGAGSAGLAAAQALAARDVDFVVFEAGSGVGGNWRYENDSGMSSAYRSLRANTSRRHTEYRCFPIGKSRSLFLDHTEMLDYLERFTDHFDLRRRIRFRTRVTAATPVDGAWDVTADGTTERFTALTVATGYNSVPRYPKFPGRFDGLQMHTHDYRTPEPFRDRDVVVVGMGCSASELAAEVRAVARSVALAARSGSWVTPRRWGPIPIDWFETSLTSRLPIEVRRPPFALLFRLAAGGRGRSGLPAPDHPIGHKPITVSDDFLPAVRSGRIVPVAPVVELRGDRVLLADGSERRADALLYGTGYHTRFDFLPPEADAPTNERAALYRGVLSLATPNLFFIGLAFVHGALIPVMEAQANWAADVVAGRLALPSAAEMRRSVELDDAVRARYFDRRFAFLWDRLPYCRALESESAHARRQPGRTATGAVRPTVA
ncbi:MAG TPA: NAD(P)-binding domain-containing protein [Candidatus Acidoferrales bacterium]|nr:NAD(P)-binding domain-containing protein [Candidatus Acidoferrales bacterium]